MYAGAAAEQPSNDTDTQSTFGASRSSASSVMRVPFDSTVTDAMPQARFACSTMSGRSSRKNGSPPEMISCDNPAAASPSTAHFMSARGASARRLRCSSSE